MSPQTVNMKVGDKVTLAASVDAGAGVTVRTVTWTSSNTAIVTVDGTGIVTGVAVGTASVVAAATADPTVKSAAVITVAAAGGGTPSISIASTNTTVCGVAGCNSVPANLSNFGTGTGIGFTGQLDVTVNVDANGSTLKSVQGTLTCGGNKLTAQQILSAAPTVAADENAAPVALTFPTAQFDPKTGAPALFNTGAFNVKDQTTPPCQLAVSVTPTAGSSVNASALSVTLNNLDVAIVNTTKSGNSASDAFGLPWVSGDITVAVLPVLYSQRTAASLLITLPGAAGATQTVPAAATGSTSATWANSTTPSSNVAQKTLNTIDANGFPAGVHPTVTVIDAAGNSAALGQGNPTSQSDFRIDNQSPQPPLSFQIPQSQGQWVNGSYAFSSSSSSAPAAAEVKYIACGDGTAPTATNPQTGCSAQAGVSAATSGSPIPPGGKNPNSTLKVFAFDVTTGATVPGALTNGTSTSSTTCNAASTANGWIDVSTDASTLTEGPTNTRYIVRAVETDKLGNIRCNDLATAPNTINTTGGLFVRATMGSDKTPPTVPNNRLANSNEVATAVNDQQAVGCPTQPPLNTAGTNCAPAPVLPSFTFSAIDNLSGFSAAPVSTKMTRFSTGGTATCIIGTGSSCNATFLSISPVLLDNGTNVDGYYTYTASVFDLATNFTALPSRTALVDRQAPVMGGIQVPATLTGGQAVNFATQATDNLDLISSDFTLTYAIAPAGLANNLAIRAPGPSLGVAFDNTLTTASSFSFAVASFVRTIATTSAANAPQFNPILPTNVTGRTYDAGSNQSAPSTSAITAANIPLIGTGIAPQTNFTLPQPNTAVFQTFQVSNAAASISNCDPTAVAGCPAHATTVNLTATATGTEGAGPPAFQFLNPFPAGLSFYYNDPVTLEWILIGTVPAPSVSDNVTATIRTFTWTFGGWDPPTALGTGAVNIVAIGVNSVGDGLASANNAAITLTSP